MRMCEVHFLLLSRAFWLLCCFQVRFGCCVVFKCVLVLSGAFCCQVRFVVNCILLLFKCVFVVKCVLLLSGAFCCCEVRFGFRFPVSSPECEVKLCCALGWSQRKRVVGGRNVCVCESE